MTRRRVHLTGRWPTLAETARVFKLSAATQRRISREVAEFLKEYKEALAAGNGRGTAVKPPRRAARKAAYHPGRVSHARAPEAFLNVPFDGRYTPLYLAAIAGLCGLGLRPRGVVEIAGPQRRLERIQDLLGRCPISVHDLSRVELSRGAPRFNMPFELGLAVGHPPGVGMKGAIPAPAR